jgi:hypothetical protein
MGDERRGQIFAQFIVKQFPKAQRVLDVAGGKGQVARKLANKKRDVVVIDNHPRFEGRAHPRIKYIKGWFTEDSEMPDCDVVVGMHPDEATAEIVLYAVKHRLPFAVVPCCRKGRHSENVNYPGWLARLRSLARGYDTYEAGLKMRGMNTVVVGKPRG